MKKVTIKRGGKICTFEIKRGKQIVVYCYFKVTSLFVDWIGNVQRYANYDNDLSFFIIKKERNFSYSGLCEKIEEALYLIPDGNISG